ncbi:hypothetical protein [Pseudomonas aeruginosa]|uniref:hypothetical protein n=1 Tax=Pseudomonas aeruginosa TaxID=287 RepID=UPI0013CDEDBD|nr:hypothetical protein [Pseudomonas aeruginosa]
MSRHLAERRPTGPTTVVQELFQCQARPWFELLTCRKTDSPNSIGAAPTCNESAHAAVGTRLRTGLLSGGGKSLLRKEKRLRVNMEIAREKSTVIIR